MKFLTNLTEYCILKYWWFMAAGREKKLICDTEGEIVVAHGRLPSTARSTLWPQDVSSNILI